MKSLNKYPSLPKQIVSGDKVSTIVHEQVDIMNEFFHSVFLSKTNIQHFWHRNEKPYFDKL